jgi:hypothetical protein
MLSPTDGTWKTSKPSMSSLTITVYTIKGVRRMTNLEMIQKAAEEIFNAKTPEEIEHFTRFITFLLMG